MIKEQILGMKADHNLNDLVGKTFGFAPRIEFQVMNREETAFCIGFDYKNEADEWLKDNIEKYPNGWVATEGYHVVKEEIYKNFSGDIATAWEVVEKVKSMFFSKRRKFMETVQFITSKENLTNKDNLISFSDVFWFITPEVICKAALLTVLEE